ncbi:deoxyguanosinetriphosphate triphosphohydrolase-like protein [Planctomycetales bacterium]|nr:deoxyguanosinetriphosphate triphosphohydrolase-like protein [Planctomycetales bacterium]
MQTDYQTQFAKYAFPFKAAKGRQYAEKPHPYRNVFQRDRDRVIHCAAFRRLSEKMQVFTAEFGNYHRTRLTHTLEVTGAARTLGRTLGLNEDLIEAAALLHDIGHPPFGHTGEETLNRLLEELGGFDHNAQALRIVEKLESRYAGFPGLNLTYEILEGQRYKVDKLRTPLLEIQCVDVADSIAYDTHDVDDALVLGLLSTKQLIQTALWKQSAYRVRQLWTNLDDEEFHRAVVHDLIDWQISDVVQASRKRLADISSYKAALRQPILVRPSNELAEQKQEAEIFLLENVYRHPKIMRHRKRVAKRIEKMFAYYVNHPNELPKRYELVLNEESVLRAVGDYIADQTDRTV